MLITQSLKTQIIKAIKLAQNRLIWKPGKDIKHLTKRIQLRHLSPNTTLAEYERLIYQVFNQPKAQLYLFQWGSTVYPTVVAIVENRLWLVMIGLDGVMETAFPPTDPDDYLADPAYFYVDLLEVFQNE